MSAQRHKRGQRATRAAGPERDFIDGIAFRRIFHFGLALKGIDGALEAIGGMALLFIPAWRLSYWLDVLVARELSNHPDDWIGRAIVHGAHAFSVDARRFASIYLIGHGVVKLLLVVAVWRERPWAFPIALWFMGFFLLYQIYRFAHTHSIALMVFTILDVFVLWVIWRDRQLLRHAPIRPLPFERVRRVR